jgi:hypothetical protein
MKLLVAASALALSVSCAYQGSEPLTSAARDRLQPRGSIFQPGAETSLHRVSRENPLNIQPGQEVTAPEAPPAAEPTFEEAARAELVATVDYASEQALVAGEAGMLRDRFQVEAAAVELGDAAALLAQRAQEMQTTTTECGCGGCTEVPAAPNGDIDNAVVVSALAAEAAFGIVDELNPPSETVCTDGGCHTTCETVPGTVDQVALDSAIDAAFDAAEGCAAAGDAVAAL